MVSVAVRNIEDNIWISYNGEGTLWEQYDHLIHKIYDKPPRDQIVEQGKVKAHLMALVHLKVLKVCSFSFEKTPQRS